MTAGPYSIGSDVWNGLSKLMEEAGEVVQVGGKIIGAGGAQIHFDGSDLRARMVEEVGDLQAAIWFFVVHNDFDNKAIVDRARKKFALFQKWDADNRTAESVSPDRGESPSP